MRTIVVFSLLSLFLSGCENPSIYIGNYSNQDICKALINAEFYAPLETISVSPISSNIYKLSYNRVTDGKYWEYRCRVVGDEVVWAGVQKGVVGRWRDNYSLDPKATFSVIRETGALEIRFEFSDGSFDTDTYAQSQLTGEKHLSEYDSIDLQHLVKKAIDSGFNYPSLPIDEDSTLPSQISFNYESMSYRLNGKAYGLMKPFNFSENAYNWFIQKQASSIQVSEYEFVLLINALMILPTLELLDKGNVSVIGINEQQDGRLAFSISTYDKDGVWKEAELPFPNEGKKINARRLLRTSLSGIHSKLLALTI